MRPGPLEWALLVALSLMWGTAFGFTRVAVETLPPTTVVASRVLIAALLLTLVARALGLRLPDRSLWSRLALLAAAGNALPFFLIAWGQQRIDSGLAGILMAVMPLATLGLAHAFVPGERLTGAKLTGFGLGLAGVAVLVGPAVLRDLGGAESTAQLAVLGGALSYAINAILSRRLPVMHPIVSSAGVMWMATLIMLPIALLRDRAALADGALDSLLATLALGLIATAAGTVTYFRLIVSSGPTFVSGTNYLIPLVAVGVGVLLLGEQPGWRAVVALAMILGGLGLSQLGRTRQ